MKSTVTLLIICLLGCLASCQGQALSESDNEKTEGKTELSDTAKQMNLLDEQTKIMGDLFELVGSSEDNPLDGVENYAELIEKIDLPNEQKDMLREQYKVYDLSLDPKKKDSLKLMVNKMITEAIEKSQSDPDD